jgi:hypothetical protein
MQTGDLIPLASSLISSLINMPCIQFTVVLVCYYGKGDLMELIVNQLRLTGVGMMQLVGVTSIFMALLSITSNFYMKVRSHGNFIIPHFHLALSSLSEPPLHRQVLTLGASLSLMASILCSFLAYNVHTIFLSLEQILFLLLHLSPRHNYTMLRERGKPK